MSKVVTSVTVFNDAVGVRLSATYSELDNGRVVKDNVRIDRVITDDEAIKAFNTLKDYAATVMEG